VSFAIASLAHRARDVDRPRECARSGEGLVARVVDHTRLRERRRYARLRAFREQRREHVVHGDVVLRRDRDAPTERQRAAGGRSRVVRDQPRGGFGQRPRRSRRFRQRGARPTLERRACETQRRARVAVADDDQDGIARDRARGAQLERAGLVHRPPPRASVAHW
jgi:hypothetical protein